MSEIELKIRSRDINVLINIISSKVSKSNIDIIKKAYNYSINAHKDQVRLSGEPYIIHPLEVAIILANLQLDTPTIVAAFLHDVVEDTDISIDIIKQKFSSEIANLVDGVTKISTLKKKTTVSDQADYIRKMLIASIKDVRVILIKLADKLHNMRTIMFHNKTKQKQIAKEVLDIYAPLAGRLGISKIRSELEDIAFHVLDHEKYHEIANLVAQRKNKIEEYIDNIRNILEKYFKKLNIKVQISGRAKHFYGILMKMKMNNKSFNEIFDIRAIRIITKEVKDCYGILGIIHSLWTPITSRFKDYIAVPKSNMYQSLHTTVIGPDKQPLEIQIRTREMHETSEVGIAAHWLYKEDPSTLEKKYKDITIFRNMDKWGQELKSSKEFMTSLKMDLYHDEIFVFTPKGKIIKLAKDSSPIDFAYAIHTEIGNKCIGAKVNNTIVPLKSELKGGDIVEILTGKKGHPSESWLKFVKSSNARYKIRNWNRKYNESIKKKTKTEKTAEISITDDELVKIKNISKQKNLHLSINGTSNIMTKLSQCCQPIPGDKVVGFITRGRGITVHKKSCASLKRLANEKERLINIEWESSGNRYPVKITVEAIDRPNLLMDITNEISLNKTNILRHEGQVIKKEIAIFRFVLEVKGVSHLNELISKLTNITHVTDVYKVNEKIYIK